MRITIVLGPFIPPPPSGCGAIELLWSQLAKRFVESGHSVVVISRAWPGQVDEYIEGVRYVRRGGFNRSARFGFDLLKDCVYSLRVIPHLPRADVVVANCFWLPALSAILQRLPGVKTGKTVMNLQRMPKGQLQLYRFTSRIAATSSAVATEACRQSPSISPLVKVLPNPIDTAAFARSKHTAAPQDSPVVLYTGRIHPEKGLVLLVRACGRLVREGTKLTLRLVGPSATHQGGGGQPFIDQLNDAAKESGVSLELRPPVTARNDLAREIWDCTVYCYPSLADQGESFGVAPLEAMAAGVAPVVSDLACFRDFVDPEQNAIVFNHRGDGAEANLAAAIGRLLSSAEMRDRLGQAAVATAQRFSIASVAEQYLADFSEITGLPAAVHQGVSS